MSAACVILSNFTIKPKEKEIAQRTKEEVFVLIFVRFFEIIIG